MTITIKRPFAFGPTTGDQQKIVIRIVDCRFKKKIMCSTIFVNFKKIRERT
jgi:hypothetical protein